MTADWKALQKAVYQNKLDHRFNVTDVNMEFCHLYGEVGEAYTAWRRNQPGLGSELADVAIYLLGLAEILGLEDEVLKKMEINRHRKYATVDGVWRKVEDSDGHSAAGL